MQLGLLQSVEVPVTVAIFIHIPCNASKILVRACDVLFELPGWDIILLDYIVLRLSVALSKYVTFVLELVELGTNFGEKVLDGAGSLIAVERLLRRHANLLFKSS